jgi:hypothetical protein
MRFWPWKARVPNIPAFGKKLVSVGPGHKCGHRHSGVLQLNGERLTPGKNERLGGVINSQHGTWLKAGHRGCVEKATAPELNHGRKEKFGEAEQLRYSGELSPYPAQWEVPTTAKAKAGIVNEDVYVDAFPLEIFENLLWERWLLQIAG